MSTSCRNIWGISSNRCTSTESLDCREIVLHNFLQQLIVTWDQCIQFSLLYIIECVCANEEFFFSKFITTIFLKKYFFFRRVLCKCVRASGIVQSDARIIQNMKEQYLPNYLQVLMSIVRRSKFGGKTKKEQKII